MRQSKRLFYVIVCCVLIAGIFMLPATIKAVDAEPGDGLQAADGDFPVPAASAKVKYIECSWNGASVERKETERENVAAFPNSSTVSGGWYYLNSDVTVNDRVYLLGDTHLILGDGFTLDVRGLYILQGKTLTIYGQSGGSGKIYSHPSSGAGIGAYAGHKGGDVVIHGGVIEAKGYDHCAGIGSNDGDQKEVGSFTMYGGTVTATGGDSGAGIGGGRGSEGGKITIYGGTVTATGKHYGAGIGGGNGQGTDPLKGAHAGTITIWGGTVTATGGDDGAGIGGGEGGNAGTIVIHGGTVTAKGGSNSAGIGCGEGESTGTGGSVTINGGTVTATGGDDGAGIGGGEDGYCSSITINGGTVTANAGRQAAAIGGGNNADSGSITITGGTITANATKSNSQGIGSGYDSDGGTSVILSYTEKTEKTISITAKNYNGEVTLQRPFKNAGGSDVYAAGTYTETAQLGQKTLKSAEARTEIAYRNLGGTTETEACVLMARNMNSWFGGWYAVTTDLAISGQVSVQGNVNLILADGCTLTCENIEVSEGDSLTIWGQSAGTGKLVAISGNNLKAGIGGADSDCGTITINGGTVEAKGASSGVFGSAGIGGAVNHKPGTVVINGGTVTATGGSIGGAGIGGGTINIYTYESMVINEGRVEIHGGTVTARAGKGAAGIGSGLLCCWQPRNGTGTIVITGGTVNAYGNIIKWSDGLNAANIYGTTAAIGGGFCSNAGSITISGGTVNAYDNGGAGIGSGCGYIQAGPLCSGGTINISGGKIFASGSEHASAIGGGYKSGDVTINISGGEIFTNDGNSKSWSYSAYAYGIGSGWEGAPCHVTISWTEASKDTMSLRISDFKDHPKLTSDFAVVGENKLITAADSVDRNRLNGKTLVPYAGEAAPIHITVTGGQGTMTANPAAALHGETVVLTAAPDAGYFTQEVTLDGKTIYPDASGTYTIAMTYTVPEVEILFRSLDAASPWTALQDQIDRAENNATITLSDDVTAYVASSWNEDWEDTELHIPAGKTITLDLNGKKLDRGLGDTPFAERGSVLVNDGTLIITSSTGKGIITGGGNRGDGGAIRNNGTLTIEEGVTISGNRARNSGGAIHNSGILNVTGGTITGNTARYYHGGGIYNGGTLNLTGGTIYGNKADEGQGGGILQNGIMNVSGAPDVSGNQAGTGSNILLRKDHPVLNITGVLTDGAKLYVTAENGLGTFTSGYSTDNGSTDPRTVFHPDNKRIFIAMNNGEAELSSTEMVTVAFDGDGGSETATQMIYAGNTAEKPADPSRAGFHFLGWYEVTDDTDTLAEEPFGFDTAIYEDTTLKAVWGNTVTFDKGNSETTDTMAAVTVKTGTAYVLPESGFVDADKIFLAWSVKIGDAEAVALQPNDEISVTAETTVTAEWAYFVYFSAGDSAAAGSMDYMTLAPGTEYTLPDCRFTATGKAFKEWSVQTGNSDATRKKAGAKIAVTGNTIATAVWECSITFNAGNTAATGTMSPVAVESGTEYTLPTCGFALNGKTFTEWQVQSGNDVANLAPGETVAVSSNMTVTALWVDNCTITYKPGDETAEGTMPAMSVAKGTEITLPACGFSAGGKTFMKWSVTMDGETWTQAPGDEFRVTADAMVTAVWGYKVTFGTGTGTGTMAPVTVETDTIYTLPTCDFEGDGKTFREWSVAIGTQDAMDKSPDDEITITADTTVTAVWGYLATFRVVHGAWDDDGTKDDRYAITEGNLLVNLDEMPYVGFSPDEGYAEFVGSWDIEPPIYMEGYGELGEPLTKDTVFTYTYAAKEAAVITETPKARNLTYNGEAQELATAGETGDGTMLYASGDENGATGDFTESIPRATGAGTYYVWYKAAGDRNHLDSAVAGPVEARIGKAENPVVIPDRIYLEIGGKSIDLGTCISDAAGTVTYSIDGEDRGCVLVGSNLTSGGNSGTCSIKVTVAESDNYLGKTGTITVQISNMQVKPLAVTQEGTTYGDALPDPAFEMPEEAMLWYWYYMGTLWNGESLDGTKDGEIPQKAGSYTVTVYCESADTIWTGTASFEIEARSIWDATVTLNLPEDLSYNSEKKTVSVAEVRTEGGVKLTADDYEVSGQVSGTEKGKYTVTVTGKGNYRDTAAVSWSITGARPTIVTVPTASAIIWGQALADSSLAGGVAELGGNRIAGIFAWKDGTIKPSVSDSQTTEYEVVYTPRNDEDITVETLKVKLTVNRAPLNITAPKAAENLAYTGDEQALITAGTVEGGYGTLQYAVTRVRAIPADDRYSALIPKAADVGTWYVWYKAVGDENHETFTADLPIEIEIEKAANTIFVTETAFLQVGGHTLDLATCVTGTEGEVKFEIDGDPKGCTLKDGVLKSGTDEGICIIKVTADGNDNYLSGTGTVKVTLTAKGTQALSFAEDPVNKNFGNEAFINPLSGAKTKVSYQVSRGTDVAEVAADGTVTIKAAGKAVITATAEETAETAGASISYTLIVGKAASAVTKAPEAINGLVENDGPQKLVTEGAATGGKIRYALGDENGPSEEYTTAVPEGTKAGTYYVWYMVAGDGNHQDTDAKVIRAVIEEKLLAGDVNGDRTVDGRDILRLMKWLAGENDPETGKAYEINLENADLNGDGTCDEKDLLELAGMMVKKDEPGQDEKTVIPGDVNDDGDVDGRDAIRLMNFLAGEINPETGEIWEINEKNADMNEDEAVDEKDLLRLVKMLAEEQNV